MEVQMKRKAAGYAGVSADHDEQRTIQEARPDYCSP